MLACWHVVCCCHCLARRSNAVTFFAIGIEKQTFYSMCSNLSHLLFITLVFVVSHGDCWTPAHEAHALWDIYMTSHGVEWTWKDDLFVEWNFTSSGDPVSDPCSTDGMPWEALSCSPSGDACNASVDCHVTVINLRDHNLVGSISPSIGNFSHLESLIFWENMMTGTIPTEIGKLGSTLTLLDLDDNGFVGTIPEELYQLTNLVELYMAKNSLSGTIPSEFSKSDMGPLTNLIIFVVAQNNLNGTIPDEFSQLTRLRLLSLGINDFTGCIPPSLGNLKRLAFLGLHFNSLTSTIPRELQGLTGMKNLWLHNNMLTGQLPREGALLEELDTFFVHNNLLTGTLPTAVGGLPSVFVLRIFNNLLTGTIPSSIGRMSHVETFDVSGNFLTGTLPDEVGSLASLEDLELHDNCLTGALPAAVGLLANLLDLELSNNLFTSIPMELGNLTKLKKLFVQNNKLEGVVADLFWQPQLMTLQHLDMSGNLLRGSIPPALFAIPGISTVALSINCLTGALSPLICGASGVSVMSLDGVGAAGGCPWNNKMFPVLRRFTPLEGSIPACIWSMSNLTALHLAGNGLTGTIGAPPPASSLKYLSLGHNRLSGTIPRVLQENTQLLELDLSYNKITGEYSHGRPGQAAVLKLQVNRLSGRLKKGALELVDAIDILIDNSFDCRDIPRSDVNFRDYSCESVDLDNSLYSMVAIIGFLVCLFIVVVIHRRYFMDECDHGKYVGIETEPHAYQRFATLLVNATVYFHCLDDLLSLSNDHVLVKICNFSDELYAILKGSVVLLCVSIVMSIPLYSLKLEDSGVQDGEYSMYTRMYSWLFSAAYTTGEVPAVLLLISWDVFMACFVYFVWRFCQKYGDLFFERFSSANIAWERNETLKMAGAVILNCGVNVCVNASYVFSTAQNTSREITFLIQVTMAVWNIFASLVLVPTLSKPIKDFDRCIKTRLAMFISNSMIIPCLVSMRVSPSCFESMFNKPTAVSTTYSYDDCLRGHLLIDIGVYECLEYGHFTVEVPPLTPPFVYNYDCSSVILTSYIPVYIYMYALLSVTPLFMMFFGLSCKYEWLPPWLQARFPGILWPYQWAFGGSVGQSGGDSAAVNGGAARVRTESDMSNESVESAGSDPGVPLPVQQQPAPSLMINVVTIVTSLMHSLYILSTFGLCSPYLAIMIVICNSSHITMWKVMLGRFVTCRVTKGIEVENVRKSSVTSFSSSNITYMMRKNASRHDAALRALSEQVSNAKGIFAICIWPILLTSSFFFMFGCLDIAGDKVSWTGGLWIPAVFVVAPVGAMWVGMQLLIRKRAKAAGGHLPGASGECTGSPSSSGDIENDADAVELSVVKNVLHSSSY